MVRFAHLADCHVGAWRDERLRALVDRAFTTAIENVLSANVDFVLIAGDLFNTALPGIDHVKLVVRELGRLKQAGIRVYFIAGSHDYSPTGKTMLSVLEEAGLGKNVYQPRYEDDGLHLDMVSDEPTGYQLCGILGKAGQLDKELYQALVREELEAAPGKKIFLFHTTLEELKPPEYAHVLGQSVSFLPKGFTYYAGGHVHIIEGKSLPGYEHVVYAGPLFPASFDELERLGHGGFWLVEVGDAGVVRERVPVALRDVLRVVVDGTGLSSEVVEQRVQEALSGDVRDKIVLVRLFGVLGSGSPADIDFRSLFLDAERRGAYACLRLTARLHSPSFEERVIDDARSEDVERRVIREHVGMIPVDGRDAESEEELFLELLKVFGESRVDGETKSVYQDRVVDAGKKVFLG